MTFIRCKPLDRFSEMLRFVVLLICVAVVIAKQRPRNRRLYEDDSDDNDEEPQVIRTISNIREKEIPRDVEITAECKESIVINKRQLTYVKAQNVTLFFPSDKVNWYNGALNCRKYCLEFADITDKCEMYALTQYVGEGDFKFWLGASNLGQSDATKFKWWNNNKDVGNDFWAKPPSGRTDQCVQVRSGKFVEVECSDIAAPVCVERVCKVNGFAF